LKITRSEFFILSAENFELLSKSTFPYDYVDCIEKLKYICLPSSESYSGQYCIREWLRARRECMAAILPRWIWFIFKNRWLLLVDIFETFRNSCYQLWTRSRVLLYTTEFYIGRDVETYSHQFRTSYWVNIVIFIKCDICVWVNVQTGMHRPTSTCSRMIHWLSSNTVVIIRRFASLYDTISSPHIIHDEALN